MGRCLDEASKGGLLGRLKGYKSMETELLQAARAGKIDRGEENLFRKQTACMHHVDDDVTKDQSWGY